MEALVQSLSVINDACINKPKLKRMNGADGPWGVITSSSPSSIDRRDNTVFKLAGCVAENVMDVKLGVRSASSLRFLVGGVRVS